MTGTQELALTPLGAGELIDRAVRLYRHHFLTLIRIAAPPVLVSAVGSTLTTISFRAMSSTPSGAWLALYVLMFLGGGVLMICGSLFSLIVMGGATRNLVAYLLWEEPVTFRTTYSAVKSRFWGLLGASFLVAAWLGLCFWLAFMAFYLIFVIMMIGLFALASISGWISAILGSIVTLAAVLSSCGPHGLCAAGDAGRRPRHYFRDWPQLFVGQR